MSDFAVSTTQLGFLLRNLAEPERGIGIVQSRLDFAETFEPDRFVGALRRAVVRHETLRKSFRRTEAGAVQRVHHSAVPPVRLADWSALPAEARADSLTEFLEADRRRGFDPAEAPLVRLAIFTLADRHAIVVLTYSHLILDGPSRDHILAEILRDYDQTRAGQAYRPVEPVSDRSFHLRPVDPMADDAARAFWQATLADLPSGSPLTVLRRAETALSGSQHRLMTDLDESTTDALKGVAERLGCAPGMLAYAAWALTLHRIGQEREIGFLAIRNGRSLDVPGIARMVGPLITSVPLRVTIDRGATGADLVRTLARQWTAVTPHEHTPLGRIAAWTGHGSETWDSNILYHHDRFAAGLDRSGGTRRADILEYSDVPLSLAVTRGRRLGITLQYWPDAFRPGAIEDLAESFRTSLIGLAEDPDRAIGALPYLSPAQRRRLVEASSGPAGMDEAATLHGAFEALARTSPDLTALGTISYGRLDRAANALARRLRADGVGPETPVAALIERSPAHLIAVLAILKAGGAYLPLEPGHPDRALAEIIDRAGATLCLTSAALASRAAIAGRCRIVDDTCRDDAPPLADQPRPDQLAYLIATSGTTGQPSIVEVEHRAAANTIRHSIAALYAPGDLAIVPWMDSPAFDASLHQIFAPLSAGGMLVPVASWGDLGAVPEFARFTTLGATPTVLRTLLDSGAVPPSLRAVMTGGEPCPPDLAARLAAGSRIRRVFNVYGPTEAAIYCTAEDIMEMPERAPSIGRPITGLAIRILDQTGQDVPPCVPGEIHIAGIGLARGYRTEDGAKRFIGDGADRCYRTGDLAAWLPDGRIEFRGRIDRQVKLNGVRLELDAVERLLAMLPGVARALVGLRPGPGGTPRLAAWVEAMPGIMLDPAMVRSALRDRLPAAAVPPWIMPVARIPFAPSGKPDLAALPDPVAVAEAGPASPADPIERAVAEEWRRLLGHDRFDQDFFEVGGDSLMGLELLLRLGERLRCRPPTRPAPGTWTVGRLAALYRAAEPAGEFVAIGPDRAGAPVFWLSDGGVIDLADLDRIASDRPVRLNHSAGDLLAARQTPIPAIVDRLLPPLRALQPQGPYRIGAYCACGLVAVALAQRLEAAGDRVECLGLVDRPGPSFAARQLGRLSRLGEAAGRLMAELRAGPRRHAPLIASRFVTRLVARRLPNSPTTDPLRHSLRRYRQTGTFRAPLLLLETDHSPAGRLIMLLPRRGWGAWARGPVRVLTDRSLGAGGGISRMIGLLGGEQIPLD